MISIICATRGRPEPARLMAASAYATAKGPVEVILGLDADDPCVNQYINMNIASTIITPDWGFGFKTHVLAGHASGDMILVVGDDAVFQTKEWDARFDEIAAKHPDGIFCINANDGLKKPGKTGYPHPCVGRKWYEILGYVYHPMFYHFCGDRWLEVMSRELDRFYYLDDVFILHRRASIHPDVQKDETFYRVRNKSVNSRDEALLFLANDYMKMDLDKLRAEM